MLKPSKWSAAGYIFVGCPRIENALSRPCLLRLLSFLLLFLRRVLLLYRGIICLFSSFFFFPLLRLSSLFYIYYSVCFGPCLCVSVCLAVLCNWSLTVHVYVPYSASLHHCLSVSVFLRSFASLSHSVFTNCCVTVCCYKSSVMTFRSSIYQC